MENTGRVLLQAILVSAAGLLTGLRCGSSFAEDLPGGRRGLFDYPYERVVEYYVIEAWRNLDEPVPAYTPEMVAWHTALVGSRPPDRRRQCDGGNPCCPARGAPRCLRGPSTAIRQQAAHPAETAQGGVDQPAVNVVGRPRKRASENRRFPEARCTFGAPSIRLSLARLRPRRA
jgi:hypothetical protein